MWRWKQQPCGQIPVLQKKKKKNKKDLKTTSMTIALLPLPVTPSRYWSLGKQYYTTFYWVSWIQLKNIVALTHFTITTPPENIRKPLIFMFSGSIDRENWLKLSKIHQPAFTCSKLIIETLEQRYKSCSQVTRVILVSL